MSKTLKIAFCGIVSALCIAVMLCSSLIPFSSYAAPMFAGALIIAIVIEADKKYALFVYIAVCVLSVLIVPNKETVLLFILFMGYYPILKGTIEGNFKKAVQWVLKLSVFNIAMIAVFFLGNYLLAIPKEEYTIGKFYLPWVFLLLGNIVFLVYDKMLSQIVSFYVFRLHPKLKKLIK